MQEGELSEFTGNMTDRLLNVVGPYNWFNYFFSPNLQILGPHRDQRGFFFLLQADILLTPAGNVRTLPNITKMFCVYVMSCHVILYIRLVNHCSPTLLLGCLFTSQNSYLHHTHNVGQTALKKMPIHKHTESKASSIVSINHLPNEPRTCERPG